MLSQWGLLALRRGDNLVQHSTLGLKPLLAVMIEPMHDEFTKEFAQGDELEEDEVGDETTEDEEEADDEVLSDDEDF